MRIVLVNPPQIYFSESFYFMLVMPIGLMYIASALEKAGHEVSIVDAFTLDEGLNLRRRGGMIHIGASWSDIKDAVMKMRPDVVGITNTSTSQLESASRIASAIKSTDSRIKIVLGGPHASASPHDTLVNYSSFDYAVMGEGEAAVVKLVECIEEGRPPNNVGSICYRKKGRVIVNEKKEWIEDLDSLPIPAYHMLDMEKYFRLLDTDQVTQRSLSTSSRKVTMITSRGCPFNCIFCSINIHMGRKWRAHSADYVIEHIKHLVKTYNVKHIAFEDDNLTLDSKRFERILDGIIDNELEITWDVPNGMRADSLDEKLLRKCKKSGATRIVIAVESGVQRILDDVIDKNLDLNDVISAADACKKVGLGLYTFFVIGMPGEKKEDIARTFKYSWMLLKRYGATSHFSIATPLIGTRLHKLCKDNGYLCKDVSPLSMLPAQGVGFDGGMIRTEDFDPEYLCNKTRKYYANVDRYRRNKWLVDTIRPDNVIKVLVKDPAGFIPRTDTFLRQWFKR